MNQVSSEKAPSHDEEKVKKRRWAVVRFFLGLAQIMGGTVGMCFLWRTGTSELTVAAVLVTGLLVILSRWLFRAS